MNNLVNHYNFDELTNKERLRIESQLLAFLTNPKTAVDDKTIWAGNVKHGLSMKTKSKKFNYFSKKSQELIVGLTFFNQSSMEEVPTKELYRSCFNIHFFPERQKYKAFYFTKLPYITELLLGCRFRDVFETYKEITGQHEYK